ncbi:glycosyltransferase [Providencia rettgeri]|uniref:Glycosyltransferase n=1 Tax=Providencia rettgeri TaxID=587 RepID=A0AAW6UPZ8_PRORE|nr:glycosyltransferase [Providencia rettgeri]ELR5060100.1 glycosyltransferase [Providencia rettgeri]ELR5235888.1 glycosyltransferase [Providencia rettgeri]ELU1337255.1 glycosyltransferase [Providencia rettgeri]EMC2742561.1 glycosyltransferase [Providencia rettgeri]EMD6655764.1 glycosyltransferase [Providencia rettgeri]
MNINPLKAPDNEASIMEHWKYTDKVYISCVCITYNQENYIKDAVDGMLAQITDYRFEIIIHDDKSTDSTREILLEYKKKYPNLIKLVLQDENQYQKGKKITPLAIAEAIGEYIALCEGDDYWIDNEKLQKQINNLYQNSNINLIITPAISLYPDGNTKDFCNLGKSQKLIAFDDCILGPVQDFFPTASFFFKKELMSCLPKWYYSDAPVGDYYMQLYFSFPNGCLYIPSTMVVYRREAINSWTSRTNEIKYLADLHKRVSLIDNLKLDFGKNFYLSVKKVIYLKSMLNISIKNKKVFLTSKILLEIFKLTPTIFKYMAIKTKKNKKHD